MDNKKNYDKQLRFMNLITKFMDAERLTHKDIVRFMLADIAGQQVGCLDRCMSDMEIIRMLIDALETASIIKKNLN